MTNDTSRNRTYQQLPDSVSGFDIGGAAFIAQPVAVSGTYPGDQVVKVTGTVDRIYIQPARGQLVFIDALTAGKGVTVQSSRADQAPVGTFAAVPAGSLGFLVSDGSGWFFVATASSGGAGVVVPPLSPVGDDGANITAVLAGTDVTLVPNAVYTITTPIDVSTSPEKTLYVNGAILKGNMAPTGGTANSVIKSVPTIAGTGNTTLTTDALVGSDQLNVTAVAGALVLGAFIRVRSVANAALQTIYQVLRVNALALTVDRPILEPFLNTDVVEVVSVMPHDVKVIGPGTITGSGDRGVDFQGMRRGLVTDLKVDVSILGLANATLSGGIIFDLSCVECVGERNECVGRNTAANTDVFDVSLGMFGAELCRFVGSQGRRATVAGVQLKDAYRCTCKDTDGTDCAGASSGLVLSATTAATGSASTDCMIDGGTYSNNAFGVSIGTTKRTKVRNAQILNSSIRALEIGPAGLVSTDCFYEKVFIKGGAPTTAAVLVDLATINPVFQDLQIEGITGTAELFKASCDFTIRGFKAGATNTTTGNYVEIATGGLGDQYISDVDITVKTVNASINVIAITTTSVGRLFFKNVKIALGVAGDIAFRHLGLNLVELDDVEVTNPGVVAGTSGYLAGGASSLLRRKGRVDMSATATPYTLVQSDQGTFVANNAVAVPVLFKDVQVGAVAFASRNVDGGTPGLTPKFTVTAATRVDFTAINLDTSIYGYKILAN